MVNVIFGYLVVFLIVFGVFGLNILTSNVFENKIIKKYLLHIWSCIFFLIAYTVCEFNFRIIDFKNLFSLDNLLYVLLAVFPTVLIVFYSDKSKPNNKFTFKDFLDGVVMEIPQRLLAQNLFFVFIKKSQILGDINLPILLNAILWVQFILLQEVMQKRKLSKRTGLDIIASFWFSIFVGILYYNTGNIIVSMICHGLERYFKYIFKSKFGIIKKQCK